MYKNILRTIHTGLPRLLRKAGRRSNPGAAHQLKALESVEDIASDFADHESDFMDVHKFHKQYEIEKQQRLEKTRLWVVKQKYFKEKLPNFLTYAEKEQMKLLHDRDPQEWNIKKLTESFPASPEIVNKILLADWRVKSPKRLHQHDQSVIKNWEIFRAGGYPQLQPALKDHLLKFADRTKNDWLNVEREWQPLPEWPKTKGNEFSSIISSCQKYSKQRKDPDFPLLKERKPKTQVTTKSNIDDGKDTYLLDKVQDKRPMRLQELKQLKIKNSDTSVNAYVSSDDYLEQRALKAFGNSSSIGVLPKNPGISSNTSSSLELIEKFKIAEILVTQENQTRFEMKTVKDRIYIPKKLRTKGATYRVEDCYYDDDGEFLYRVPGMSGQ